MDNSSKPKPRPKPNKTSKRKWRPNHSQSKKAEPLNQNTPKDHIRIIEIEKIKTVDDLDREAQKFEDFVKTVCGLTKLMGGLRVSEIRKKKGPNSQKMRLVDENNKNQIRGLFRYKYLRAMQEVLFGPTIFCAISTDEIEKHYLKLLSNKAECSISELPSILWQNEKLSANDNKNLTKEFTSRQVLYKLRNRMVNKFYNTRSIGLDKISYHNLYDSNEDCSIMTALFNACLKVQAIPKIWVENYSVLLKENEDTDDDIKNWRLVTINSTVSKLFQNMIASRLIRWAKNTNRLSATQKGYLLTNAACESSFILQECKMYAKEHNKDLVVAWLDFSNASNYISQDAITTSLEKHGVPDAIRGIIKSFLQNSNTKIKTMSEEGFTKPIPILKGLPRGSPLSPILLDLVIEPILRSLNNDSNKFEIFKQKINHFAIPNELTVVAESSVGLQNLLDLVEKTSKLVGLRFNVNQCRTYHYDGKKDDKNTNSGFLFFGQKLQTVPDDEVDNYFGVKQGLSIGHDGIPTIDEMFDSLRAIDDSLLDGFQKTTSILTYIIPRVENYLRGLQKDDKTTFELVDTVLRNKFISWLNLLPGASPAAIVFHVSSLKKREEPEYLPFVDLFHIMKIEQAFKMLTSQDKIVKNIAFDSLTSEVQDLVLKKRSLSHKQLLQYLSGELTIKNIQSKSMWQMVREATLQLKMKISLSWVYNGAVGLEIGFNEKKKKLFTGQVGEKLKNILVKYYVEEIQKRSPGVDVSDLKKKTKPNK